MRRLATKGSNKAGDLGFSHLAGINAGDGNRPSNVVVNAVRLSGNGHRVGSFLAHPTSLHLVHVGATGESCNHRDMLDQRLGYGSAGAHGGRIRGRACERGIDTCDVDVTNTGHGEVRVQKCLEGEGRRARVPNTVTYSIRQAAEMVTKN